MAEQNASFYTTMLAKAQNGAKNISSIHMGLPRGTLLEDYLGEDVAYVAEPNWEEWGEGEDYSGVDHYIILTTNPLGLMRVAASARKGDDGTTLISLMVPLDNFLWVVTDPLNWSEKHT